MGSADRAAELAGSLVVIGDELLQGFVADRNTPLVARRLREHHVTLDSVEIVADDVTAIDHAISRAMTRSWPRLVLLTGGTGYTPDDVTIEAVASALGRDLVENPALAREVRRSLEEARRRGVTLPRAAARGLVQSARSPRGSKVHLCGGWVGAIESAVRGGIAEGGVTVLTLPGVPDHLEKVLDDVVVGTFLDGRRADVAYEEIRHDLPEIALVPLLLRLRDRFEDTEIGSYPGSPSTLRVRGPRRSAERALIELRLELLRLAGACR